MKLLIEKLPDLQALYVKEMRLFLSAEEMFAIKSLFLLEMATGEDLRQIFSSNWQGTEARADRVRDIVNGITSDSTPIKCKAVYTLFDEAEDLVQDAAHESVRDAALLAVARRIKHYEIAFCEGVRQFAAALGRSQDAASLAVISREGCEIDDRLAALADRLNAAARKID